MLYTVLRLDVEQVDLYVYGRRVEMESRGHLCFPCVHVGFEEFQRTLYCSDFR